jgi:hypothetical protein
MSFTSDPINIEEFAFDRKALYDRFVHEYTDFKASWFTVRKFTQFLNAYSEYRKGVKKPKIWKSNGVYFIQFKTDDKSTS